MAIHGQMPVSELTELEYETAVVHLTEQMVAQMRWPDRYAASDVACDALANELMSEMTVLEWVRAACRCCDIDANMLMGV